MNVQIDQKGKVKEVFTKAIGNDKAKMELEALPVEELPVSITFPEFIRRMKDMSMAGGGMPFMANMGEEYQVVVNSNHPMIRKIAESADASVSEKLAKQAFDLALLSQGMLKGKELTNFIRRSVELES